MNLKYCFLMCHKLNVINSDCCIYGVLYFCCCYERLVFNMERTWNSIRMNKDNLSTIKIFTSHLQLDTPGFCRFFFQQWNKLCHNVFCASVKHFRTLQKRTTMKELLRSNEPRYVTCTNRLKSTNDKKHYSFFIEFYNGST